MRYKFILLQENMNETIKSCILRRAMLAARDQLDPASRYEKSKHIHRLVLEHPSVLAAEHLFIYVHVRSEVETLPLIEHLLALGKRVSVPLTLPKEGRLLAVEITQPRTELAPGCFGILEPINKQAAVKPSTIDIAIVPGSVFDLLGARLGYGGGFYDRFLSHDAPQALRMSLAYAMQLAEQVPLEAHDQLMDIIVTEEQLYDCRRIRNAQDSDI